MDTLLVAVIISVGGPLLVFIAGWALTWWQEQRREGQVRSNIRMLLQRECGQNIATLMEYWNKVATEGVHLPGTGVLVGIGTSNEEGEFDKRQRLAREPMPAWRHLMWENQAGRVAMALSLSEIHRVYSLYSDLETFTARREELREAFDTAEGQELAKDYKRWMLAKQTQQGNPAYLPEQGTEMKLMEFNEKTRALWNECQAVYNRAFPYRDSNVIEEDAPIPKWRDRLKRVVAS